MLSSFLLGLIVGQLPRNPLKLTGGIDLQAKAAAVPYSRSKASVLFFIATDCPIANRYAPEIGRIAKDYATKGVRCYRVYVLDKSHVAEVAQHGKDYSLPMTAILDPKRSLVKETGVTVTPEVAVVNKLGMMIYRGRIDDQNVEHGVIRPGYRHDLRIALDEYLSGKPISMPVTTAIGCFL